MERKKVDTNLPKDTQPKKREDVKENKTSIIKSSSDTKSKWDRVKGINGKIVRFKLEDKERKEFLSKKNYRQLYVGIDGNDLYFYYEILD
jgi:DNA replicative helicase MCM subunit Mcm2 (Cdc46/Mcm family)